MATTAESTSAACELVAGAREPAVRLLALLQAIDADPDKQSLAKQIIRCIDRALAAVRGAGDDKKRRPPAHGPTTRPPAGSSKRRVTGRGETGARVVSSTIDDGFAWRKYGEKIISDQWYQRFYFRCSYRDEHGCGAKKQVQQTQEDPSLFQTTYFGEHTPACPRDDAPVAVVDRTSVPQVPFLASSSVGAGNDSLCHGDDEAPPSLPVKAELMQANVAEFTEDCPVDDRLMEWASADVSFASPASVGLESLDGLEELISLLWSGD